MDHGPGLTDDRANALMLAAAMAVQKIVKPGFTPLVWAVRTLVGPDGCVTEVIGNERAEHDVDDKGHRAECRACRAHWNARENKLKPGANGTHRVRTSSGGIES